MAWYEEQGLILKVGDTQYRSGAPFMDVLYAGEVEWTKVKPGEEGRLDVIAWRCLDDFKRWRELALLNNIKDPLMDVVLNKDIAYPIGPLSKEVFQAWTYR